MTLGRTVVFIAGQARSGSTLLDLMLGAHPRCVGLGEVHEFFRRQADYLARSGEIACSCGRSLAECAFWGPLAGDLRPGAAQDTRQQYDRLLAHFDQAFGPERILVDSSKTPDALQAWLERPAVDVKTIFLVRDVRGWTVSRRAELRRRRAHSLGDRIRRLPLVCFWQWRVENRRIRTFLARARVPFFQLGYEELCLSTRPMVEAMCDFLDIAPSEAMLRPSSSQSHVVVGNRMRFQSEKRQAISYDNRWFTSREWLLPSLLLPGVMRHNRQAVYRHTAGALWEQ